MLPVLSARGQRHLRQQPVAGRALAQAVQQPLVEAQQVGPVGAQARRHLRAHTRLQPPHRQQQAGPSGARTRSSPTSGDTPASSAARGAASAAG